MPKFRDFTGKKIGRVLILKHVENRNGGSKWECVCDCQNKFISWSANFRTGRIFECKECRLERRRGPDLTGRKFGRWTVLSRGLDSRNKTVWHCKCDCGAFGYIATSSLGTKKSMSCGCYGRKMKSKHVNTTLYPPSHRLSRNKFYTMKTSLIHKCYNPKHASFDKFGGKGITVCDLWRNGVKDMHEWAVKNGWKEGDVLCLKSGFTEFNPSTVIIFSESEFRGKVSIDNAEKITYKGESHTIADWCKILDTDKTSLRNRLKRFPTIDECFESPFKKQIFKRDPKLVDEIVKMYSQGKTQKEISEIMHTDSGNISYHLKKRGVKIRQEDKKRNKKPNVKDEDIKSFISKGLSMNKIGKLLGVSDFCIKKRLDKINGIKRDRNTLIPG